MRNITLNVYIGLYLVVMAGCRKESFDSAKSQQVDMETAISTKPNIILILADDVGYETPNYTGGESYSTPNLNYMASNGMQFTQARTAPLCSPSRTMLMTAKYNFRNYTTWGKLDTSQRTIANMLKKAGYATCMAGKWQFDGGNASIKKFGFDNYLVTNPFEVDASEGTTLRFYKNPQIYEKGAYWPDSLTAGKYGDDLIRNYMFNFIDSNKNKKPFFIYWATNLVHEPFCPTPDDPQFAAWNPNRKKLAGDTIYYPSMVKYMDKLIGQLITKLGNDGLQSNTLVLFLGDNGSSASIHSLWNGQIVSGDKSGTSEAGTHVPMLAFMPGQVLPGSVNNNLVSLVDFMPTIADAAKTNIPAAYGTTDGISFAPQFSGNNLSVRPWIFDHFVGSGKFETDPIHLRRWMQDSVYKQYDSLPNLWLSKKFFNIKLDPQEKKAITPGRMTQKEKALSKKYLTNMSQLH